MAGCSTTSSTGSKTGRTPSSCRCDAVFVGSLASPDLRSSALFRALPAPICITSEVTRSGRMAVFPLHGRLPLSPPVTISPTITTSPLLPQSPRLPPLDPAISRPSTSPLPGRFTFPRVSRRPSVTAIHPCTPPLDRGMGTDQYTPLGYPLPPLYRRTLAVCGDGSVWKGPQSKMIGNPPASPLHWCNATATN